MKNKSLSKSCAVIRVAVLLGLLVLVCATSRVSVVAQNPNKIDQTSAQIKDVFETGIELLDQGKWAQALPIYQQLTRSHPFYPWGWLGLGWSLHYTGQYAEAIPAYQKAIELGAQRPLRMMLEIARCHAALGKKAEAMFWFEKAMQNGLTNLAQMQTDKRLELLRNEQRFKQLVGIVDTARMTRNQGWRYDLQLLAREIKRVHYNPYLHFSPTEFERTVKEIHKAIPSLSDDEITVRMMKLVQRLGDAHSYVVPIYRESGTEQGLPILLSFFEEGLFITATNPANEELLWARVLKFDDASTDEVYAALDALVSQDNSMRLRSQAPAFMRLVPLLKVLGLTREAAKANLTIVDRFGRERSVTLAMTKGAITDWVRKPAEVRNELPLFVQNRKDYYWFKYFPETKMVYFQYNGVANMKEESIEAFATRLFDFIEQNDVATLVIDLRWNGGGNMFLNKPLLEGLIAARKVNRPGKLFVIAGRHTFSAAMVFAEQLERYTNAIFVGEPTGSRPNFVGETNFIQLPYSKMWVSLSNLYWQNSHASDMRPWIPPKVFVPPTFESYRNGRDPALEAIIQR